MAVTPQDLAAMASFRAEILQVVSPLMAAMRIEVTNAFKELHDRSLNEINTQIALLKTQVESHQRTTVVEIQRVTQEKLDMANQAFVLEQGRLTTSVEALQRAITTVGEGGFEKFSTMLPQHYEEVKKHTQMVAESVHSLRRTQFKSLNNKFMEWPRGVDSRLAAFDSAGIARPPGFGSSGPTRGSYQLRVPVSKNLHLDMLKDGNHGLAKWRKGFDLQVNAVWNGLDVVLEAMRVLKTPITQETFEDQLEQNKTKPIGASDLDWNYRYVSTKLYMVLYTHCNVDPLKILEEGDNKCWFEAYRLLSKAYDLYNENDEVT